jgi:hypothetical protein
MEGCGTIAIYVCMWNEGGQETAIFRAGSEGCEVQQAFYKLFFKLRTLNTKGLLELFIYFGTRSLLNLGDKATPHATVSRRYCIEFRV